MAKARIIPGEAGNLPSVVFFCPACKHNHVVPYVSKRPRPTDRAVWFFDENLESPTIEPSLRVFQTDGKTTACHVIVTGGFLNYCGDAKPDFANKKVAMTDCKLIGED